MLTLEQKLEHRKKWGLLDESYFDGSRDIEFDIIMQELEPVVIEPGEVSDAYVSKEQRIAFQTRFPHYKGLYYMFYPSCTYKVTNVVTIGGDYEAIFPTYVVENFFYHRMYESMKNVQYFQEDVAIHVRRDVQFFPKYNQQDEGQLKIATDLILMVDSIDWKPYDKILVIGSSSEDGKNSVSYDILKTMVTVPIQVDMYDPYEVNMTYEEDAVTFNRIKGKFQYQEEKIKEYKLVMDDAYNFDRIGSNRKSLDKDDVVRKSINYSIKILPGDDIKGTIYTQKFKTKSNEKREVTRSLAVSFREELRLCGCNACLELKWSLKRVYNDEFYEMYLDIHRKKAISHLGKIRTTKTVESEGTIKIENLKFFLYKNMFINYEEARIMPTSVKKRVDVVVRLQDLKVQDYHDYRNYVVDFGEYMLSKHPIHTWKKGLIHEQRDYKVIVQDGKITLQELSVWRGQRVIRQKNGYWIYEGDAKITNKWLTDRNRYVAKTKFKKANSLKNMKSKNNIKIMTVVRERTKSYRPMVRNVRSSNKVKKSEIKNNFKVDKNVHYPKERKWVVKGPQEEKKD